MAVDVVRAPASHDFAAGRAGRFALQADHALTHPLVCRALFLARGDSMDQLHVARVRGKRVRSVLHPTGLLFESLDIGVRVGEARLP